MRTHQSRDLVSKGRLRVAQHVVLGREFLHFQHHICSRLQRDLCQPRTKEAAEKRVIFLVLSTLCSSFWFLVEISDGLVGVYLTVAGVGGRVQTHVDLDGCGWNRDELGHSGQIVGGHGEPVEPVHTVQAAEFDLTECSIGFAPPERLLDQSAFAVTDRAPFVIAFPRR